MIAGAFARIKAVLGEQTATLVPDAAVSNDQVGRYVLVVNDQNHVERVGVEVAGVVDQMRMITGGLSPDARVVVNGLQRARPGVEVKPIETTLTEPKIDLGIETSATMPTAGPTSMPSSMPTSMPTTAPATRTAQ